MKKSTIAVICSFAALAHFLFITPTVLMWMDQNAAKHAWFWNPGSDSEYFASQLIFWEVMGVAFVPFFALITLAFMAWNEHNKETAFAPPPPRSPGPPSGFRRPPAPPAAPKTPRAPMPPPRHSFFQPATVAV